jgi:hypothetical protein
MAGGLTGGANGENVHSGVAHEAGRLGEKLAALVLVLFLPCRVTCYMVFLVVTCKLLPC